MSTPQTEGVIPPITKEEELDQIFSRISVLNTNVPENPISIEDAKRMIVALLRDTENAAQKALLDKIYDIAPDKQFGKWKPADVANFWNDMGILSRELDKSITELSPKPLKSIKRLSGKLNKRKLGS